MLLQSLLRPVLTPLMRGMFDAFGRTLAQQIAAMSPSLWLEPSVTNGYQDSAGTTALTQPGGGAADPPVGLALDLSGKGRNASQSTSTARPKLSARVNLLVGTATLSTQSVTVVAGSHTIFWTGAGTVTASGVYVGALTSGQTFTTTAGTLTLTVAGSVTSAQLNIGATAQRYQAVTNASNYDYSGFPVYWKFDGTDDALGIGSIDLSATDKVTVVVSSSTSISATLGTIFSYNGKYASPSFFLARFVTTFQSSSADLDGPIKNINRPISTATGVAVTTALFDRAGGTLADQNKFRVNGVATNNASGTLAANTSFGSFAAKIGANDSGTEGLSGNIYSVFLFPRILTAAEIAIVEKYVAQLSGVTL